MHTQTLTHKRTRDEQYEIVSAKNTLASKPEADTQTDNAAQHMRSAGQIDRERQTQNK